jgi:hypothetical protein
MKIVRVIYTARPEYVPQNSANISTVMSDLQQAGHPGIFYHSCLGADGKTFTHTAFYQSEEDQKLLNALPSFKDFQEKLQAAGFEVPPKQEWLTLVGSSKDLF